jgi:hypothetical protein
MTEYQYILFFNESTETLTVNPAGWNDIGLNFVRHEIYHSVLRSFTVSLRFARINGGGADFIMHAYEAKGINAEVLITINKRNKSTNVFELFHSGSLDMKTLSIDRDYVEVAILDGMKMQKLISRDEINYNLLSTISTDNVSVQPFLNKKQVFLTPIDIVLEAEFNGNLNGYFDEAVPLTITGEIGKISYNNSVILKNTIGDRLQFTEDNPVIYTNDTQYDIDLKINANCIFNLDVWFRVIDAYSGGSAVPSYVSLSIKHGYFVYNEDGDLVSEYTLYNQTPYLSTSEPNDDIHFYITNYQYSGSSNISIPVNGYVEFATRVEILDIGYTPQDRKIYFYTPSGQTSTNYTFITEYSSGADESATECLFPHEAFTRLIQLTTSELNTNKLFTSNFFGRTDSEFITYPDDGPGAKDAIFTGYMVRQYPNSSLTANLRELFKSFDAIYNLGMGYDKVNDRFFIEQKRIFFDSSYFMFDLGEVAELTITPYIGKYFSKITAGYENEGSYEEYQGAYEFNVQREYSLSVPVKDEKIMRPNYRFDSIGVELARRKPYITYSSLDTKQDNELFVVRTDGVRPVLNSSVQGFPGVEKYYNTMLTPRQNAIRNGSIIRPALYKSDSPIKFQTASKYISINTGIDDFNDINQAELESALFKPELYTFKSYINSVLLEVLNTNPHGFIRFSYEGTVYEGFIDSVETGDYNKEATYKLIAKNIETGAGLLYENDIEILYENDINALKE